MNNDNGNMYFAARIDNEKLRQDAAKTRRILKGIGNKTADESRKMEDSFKKVGTAIAGAFAVSKMKDFVVQVANVRGEFQKLEIAFETMLGSKAQADALMSQLVKTAATTPFGMGDIANSAKQLLAYGLEANKVNETLIRLGDIAAGLSIPINDLAYLYGTTMVQGRLYTQDLNQFLGRGIPLVAELAKQFGVAEKDVKKLVEEGKVGFPQVQQAIFNLTDEGSKFGGLMAAQAETIGGQISNIQDQIEQMFNKIGQNSEGVISGALDLTSSLIENWETIGKVLLTVIATYGTYKAAVLAVAAAHKLMSIWGTVQAFVSLIPAVTSAKDAMLLFNMACKANPLGIVLSVVAAATTAFVLFANKESETEKAIDDCNKRLKEQEAQLKELEDAEDAVVAAKKQANNETAEEINKIEILANTIRDETASLEDRKRAISQMQSIVPNYHADLDEEGRLHGENTAAIDKHIESLNKLAMAKALQAKREEVMATKMNAELDRREAQVEVTEKKQGVATAEENLGNAEKRYDEHRSNTYNSQISAGIGGREMKMVNVGGDRADKNMIVKPAEEALELAEALLDEAENKVKIADKTIANAEEQLSNLDEMIKEHQAYMPDPTSGGGGTTVTDKEAKEAQRLADAAAERSKKIGEYSDKVKAEVSQAELDIRQAEINAMEEGYEKSVAQVNLNYDRLIAQNIERGKQMVEELKDKKTLEWLNANPDATKEQEIEYRASLNLTTDDLSEEQQAMLERYAEVAKDIQTKGNREALNEMLQDVMTYEDKVTEVKRQFEEQRKQMYELDEKGEYVKDADGNKVLKKGVSEGNVAELDYQEEQALQAIDEQFAAREIAYQAWCDSITDMTLAQLLDVLNKAEQELSQVEASGQGGQKVAVARAKANKVREEVNKKKAKNEVAPDKRSIEEWNTLREALEDCVNAFEEVGDAVGGVAGEIISTTGSILTSTLSMINGIVQLVQMSSTSMQATAAAGATAISTIEKASVILAVISAALQIAMTIANLFNSDDDKQEEIEALQGRIDQLQWELDNADIMKLRENSINSFERVKQVMQEVTNELVRQRAAAGQDYAALAPLFGGVTRDSEALTKATERLAAAYSNVAYSANKALGEGRYKQAEDDLKKIAEQQMLMQEQIATEQSKKKTDQGAIDEWERKIEELGAEAIELINGIVEDIIGGSSNDIANELADAFFEAFEAGEDAAEAWGDKVNEIVADVMKRMLVQKFLEEPLGEIFDKYKSKWFKDGKFQGFDSVQGSLTDFSNELNALVSLFSDEIANLPQELQDMLKGGADAAREASEKGIATASQESVDELNGRMTAVQGHTYSISENTKILVQTATLILQSVLNIEENTDRMDNRLDNIEDNISDVKDTINDINLKGIKIR